MKKQIDWLAILRGWAVLLVIIFHATLFMEQHADSVESFLGIFNELFYFRMPLFFFISGYLLCYTKILKNGSFGSIIRERVPRILIPYIVITWGVYFSKLIAGMFISLGSPVEFSAKIIIDMFLYPYTRNPWPTLWFLNTIIVFFLCYPLLKLSLKNVFTTVSTFLLLTVFYLVVSPLEIEILNFPFVAKYFVFFYFGLLFARFELYKYGKNIAIFLISAGIMIAVFTLWKYNIISLTFFLLLYSLAGIYISIYFAMQCEKIIPTLFSSFRKYYYQIYLVSPFFHIAVCLAYEKMDSNNPLLFIVISAILGLYGPVLICKAAEKLNWKPLLRVLGF